MKRCGLNVILVKPRTKIEDVLKMIEEEILMK